MPDPDASARSGVVPDPDASAGSGIVPDPEVAVPRYVAIITDGNGRWAQNRGLPPLAGHQAGADTVKARLRDAARLGVEELTVYSFSTENWTRPAEEVSGLMQMFGERIDRETPELHAEEVRMRFIGRREGVSEELSQRMEWAERKTAQNARITLFVAFNYGGRAEIVDAARSFTSGGEDDFRRLLYAPDMHDPDLLIRTSGEQRISNYLLWQCAYSELVFRDELWPDFDTAAFEAAVNEYGQRRRRLEARSPCRHAGPAAPPRGASLRPRRGASGPHGRILPRGYW
ncbi:MAG: polyprenyl diphosphate synthase [Thermoleophilaceae bacterium]